MSSQPFAQTSHMNIAGYPATSSGGAAFGGMPRVNSKGAANRTSRREGPPSEGATQCLVANRAPSCGPPERHAAPQPPRPGQVPQLMGGEAITQGYRRSSAQQAQTLPSAMLPGTPAQG